jgi:N-acetylglucosamine kinase-like BadF-type ATPase
MIADGSRWQCGSVNPASVGAATAQRQLGEVFGALADRIGSRPAFGWFATATVDAGTPEPELDRLTALAAAAGLAGTLVISRDIVPLLAARPLGGRGVAVVCGTGSGFLAGDGRTTPVAVGGCEYLGSDEGSAFGIGLAGLRAAVRGADGRGRPTVLGRELAMAFASSSRTDTERATASTSLNGTGAEIATDSTWFSDAGGQPATASASFSGTITELARALAGRPFPKAAVAALAPAVCRCWLDGDPAASEVIGAALDELVTGVRAARDRAGLTDGPWSAVLSGGVLRGCPEFATALADRITAELGATPRPTVVDDPAGMVLSAAVTHRDRFPDTLAGHWAWPRRLETVT